jgi:hypothetical protein
MPTLTKLRSLFLPVIIGLFVVLAAGWYNLVLLPSEHKYLDDRNFRLLSTLGEEISTSINTFDKMLDNASDSGVTGIKNDTDGDNDADLKLYLKQVAPRLESLDSEDREVLGKDYGDPPNIAVRADEGTHFLYFAFRRKRDGGPLTKYAVRTDLDKLIRGLLPPANRNPYDVVLVAQRDGTVIFQSSSPGLAVTKIDAFEDESSAARTSKPESAAAKTDKPEPADEKVPPPSRRFSSNKFSEISLAGTPYRLYSQPLQLSFPLNHPERKATEGEAATRPAEKWVVCGLVRAETFRSESESISYTYFLWFSAAILLALLAPPFLKLFSSAPAERLRTREVAIAAVFACIAAATVTFMLLDVYHWRKDFDENAKAQMRLLAKAIDGNFGAEQKAAFEQLDEFAKEEELAVALHEAQVPSKELPRLKEDKGVCEPESACRMQILVSDDSAQSPSSYPYLQFAGWSDSNGDQRVKWTTRGRTTPFINLGDGSISYYPAVKRAMEDPGGSDLAPTRGIGSEYSPNTGENITVFWQLMTADGEPVTGKMDAEARKKAFCASLVTRPISVAGPVLPADFQFAIVNASGLVIFHSDASRNLRENFFAETDQDPEIRSRVLMRAEGALAANYLGHGHRFYIRPMGGNPDELWSVIVFRDLRIEQTMNLEVLSLATILFLLYALVMALATGLTLWLQKGRGAGRWLWPDSRKAATYGQLAIINCFAILLLLLLSEIPMKLGLLFCAVGIPAGVLVWNLVALKREADHSSSVEAAEKTAASPWQLRDAGTCATLLAVVAVLPCLSFFKIAWDFEHKLFLERSQIRLIDDVNARRQMVRSSYQGVQMKGYEEQLLAEPESQGSLKFLYQDSAPGTEIQAVGEYKEQKLVHCGLGEAGGPELCMELFLGTFSPLYNQFAADGRYLAEASSDIWRWSSSSSEGKEYLKLERREGEHEASSVKSELTRLTIPWGSWQWWLGSMAFLAALFWLTRFGLGRVFLLDLEIDEPTGANEPPAPNELVGAKNPVVPFGPARGNSAAAPFDPASLIAKLSKNLVVIGRSSSPTIVALLERNDVQAYDLSQPLSVTLRRVASQGGGSSDVNVPSDPVEDIVRNGRPVVFYNFECGLEGREHSQHKLATLERVLSKLPQSVVLASSVDPVANSSEAEREQWRTMLGSFVRIDLNSSPTQRSQETVEQYQHRISAEAYYRWLLSGRPKAQKLALVHLAQEKVINPNSRGVVRELMKEGLVVRRWGMLTVKDHHFSNFLKNAIPRKSIKHWEKQGAGIHAGTLRTSLLLVGAGVAGFLLYTQGAIFNTWITYMTGFAAAVPAVMKLFQLFRSGGGEAPVH